MAKILITGASGYIGSMLIRYILKDEWKDLADAEIVASVRNMKKVHPVILNRVKVVQADLSLPSECENLGSDFDFIIHCACVTKSFEMQHHPVETLESILDVTKNVLEIAKRSYEAGKLKSIVYLSSMEVYGNIDCSDGHRVLEDEMGYVDLLSARSSYPLGKRMGELLCYSYYEEYGVPVKIARLAQVFGRGVAKTETKVFAQFARSVMERTDIVLHTTGQSMGNYCGIEDAVRGIMTILMSGKDGEAYNIVNEENTMSIRDMANLVADELADTSVSERSVEGKIHVVCDIPKDNCYGYAADTGLRLSGKKLEALGWKPQECLADMYRNMMSAWDS